MLVFMVGTSHFPYDFFRQPGAGGAIFWIIWIAIWGVLELNALGLIGGTRPAAQPSSTTTTRTRSSPAFVYSAVYLLFGYVLQN